MNKEEILNILYGKETWDIWRNFQEIESSIDKSEMLYEYFDDIKKTFEYLDMDDDYDFDNSTITIGDYFLIKTKEGEKIGDHEYGRFDIYRIYLYDIESHILYRIHEKG